MSRLLKPLGYLALLLGAAFLWNWRLRYVAQSTNPVIINQLVEEVKADPHLTARLGNINQVEESFTVYSSYSDSLRFVLVFAGDKQELRLQGQATRKDDRSTWRVIQLDSTFVAPDQILVSQ